MKPNITRIVLVGTTHSGNIGATARAMKTMGLDTLYLVAPKCSIDAQAFAMASGANDILDKAIVLPTLVEALEGCHLVFATSARPRDLDLPGLEPTAYANHAAQALAKGEQVAILFGREHAGLTNEELMQSHYHVMIPSVPEFSSLNLAQAVQVMCYELRKVTLSDSVSTAMSEEEKATAEQVEQMMSHLEQVLIDIEFLDVAQPKRLMARLRRLFNRAQLEAREVNILRGILKQVQRKRNQS